MKEGFFKNKVVAVTGGAGMIGSFLCEELIKDGANVVMIDDYSKGRKENISHIADKLQIREGDLEDLAFTQTALSDAQYIFHLASRAYGVGYAEGRHVTNMLHNDRVTNCILDAINTDIIEHILMTSSSCVYDDNGPDIIPELPLFEALPENVNRGYGWAKRFLEQKSEIYSEETGVPMTIVRPFNIFGERYRWVGEFSAAIPMLVKRVLDGEDPVVMWGSGNQLRSYIHAKDCARMMMGLVSVKHTNGPVNLGTTETISISNLVRLICELSGNKPKLEFDTTKPEGRFIKSSDTTRFDSILPDFEFSTSLRDGILKMIEWYKLEFSSESQNKSLKN